jgi:hypothetical protein
MRRSGRRTPMRRQQAPLTPVSRRCRDDWLRVRGTSDHNGTLRFLKHRRATLPNTMPTQRLVPRVPTARRSAISRAPTDQDIRLVRRRPRSPRQHRGRPAAAKRPAWLIPPRSQVVQDLARLHPWWTAFRSSATVTATIRQPPAPAARGPGGLDAGLGAMNPADDPLQRHRPILSWEELRRSYGARLVRRLSDRTHSSRGSCLDRGQLEAGDPTRNVHDVTGTPVEQCAPTRRATEIFHATDRVRSFGRARTVCLGFVEIAS